MLHESYAEVMEYNDDLSRFDFVSIGEQGEIKKRIEFRISNIDDLYELGFGDVMSGDDVDDTVVSNNGDRDKVLATVIRALIMFTNKYPGRWVVFRGSTSSRTRLYRMVITLRYRELSLIFDIYGLQGDKIVPFEEDMLFSAFLFKRK